MTPDCAHDSVRPVDKNYGKCRTCGARVPALTPKPSPSLDLEEMRNRARLSIEVLRREVGYTKVAQIGVDLADDVLSLLKDNERLRAERDEWEQDRDRWFERRGQEFERANRAEVRVEQLEHGHDEWRTHAHRAVSRAEQAEARLLALEEAAATARKALEGGSE